MAFTKRQLETAFDERKARYERANETIKHTLNALLDDLSKRYGVREGLMVLGEPKTFNSFHRKATKKYKCKEIDEAFDRVRDLSRVRVLCHTLADCDRLVELLKAQRHLFVNPSTIEDFINAPSPTGYRGIHLEARVDVPVDGGSVGVPVEVQVRTFLQEAWGFYTHGDFYKGENVPPFVAQLMREFSDLLYWADKHAVQLVDEIALLRNKGGGLSPDGDATAAEDAAV